MAVIYHENEYSVTEFKSGLGVSSASNIENEQRHTEEMQEIIGTPPHWLIRWGIVGFFSILVLILSLSALIRYPDIVKTQITIRSFNLPQAITSTTKGRLIHLLVRNNEKVKAGQILAQIASENGISTIITPIAGKLVYAGIIHENQEVLPRRNVFFVGTNNEDFFGEMVIPTSSISKIREGQEVLIKAESYPYEEYGMLHGTIKYITDDNLKNGGYIAEVDFKNKSITDMHKHLVLKQGMKADAEIITQSNSLFNRLAGNILKNITH